MTKKIIKQSDNFVVKEYKNFLERLKDDIQKAQLQAALSITKELTMLYWHIGKVLSEKIVKEHWGSKPIEYLSKDLQSSFPDMAGFSVRNLKYMRKFADCYNELSQAEVAARVPWGHNMVILDKIAESDQRLWYLQQIIENGWSRSMLEHWIESNLYKRQGKAITNFTRTLMPLQSDLAEQVLKDPYNFSFIVLDKKYRERELEQGLIDHIQKFLIELGEGFAFIGRQYRLEVGGEDNYIDLLFYHLRLRCYIVVELKATDFDPRDAGQINFYLSAVDSLIKHPTDNPSIGILLCKIKNRIKVEYALRDMSKPIGVASYETMLVESLPKNLKGSLPTIEEIEAGLERAEIAEEKDIKVIKKTSKKISKKVLKDSAKNRAKTISKKVGKNVVKKSRKI